MFAAKVIADVQREQAVAAARRDASRRADFIRDLALGQMTAARLADGSAVYGLDTAQPYFAVVALCDDASGSALVREASLAVARRPDTELGHALEEGRELTGPLITELATAGDPVARGAIETIGKALGVGIVNLVNTFNPQVVVIGGGVIAAGELLLAPARDVRRER